MYDSLWSQCISQLKQELSEHQFNTWILPLEFASDQQCIRLYAPNRFVLDWVNRHYRDLIIDQLETLSPDPAPKLILSLGSHSSRAVKVQKNNPGHIQKKPISSSVELNKLSNDFLENSNLNSELSFEYFVQGKANELACAASMQVAENPGNAYNPLFIYGGVGLGKTHLMHAIGNSILKNNPQMKVRYLYANTFINDMVKALQHGKIDAFKAEYRSINTLLIDDVQFFAGKEKTQEEFFHTFNALFESQQQIVLTSDKYPKEINLEERLRSRFGWGLIVRIEPPDLETRVAILHKKALQLFSLSLPNDVAFFIAKRFHSNIRELEGALRRVFASNRFTGKPICIDSARESLRDMLAVQDKLVTVDNIQKTVAEYFNIRTSDLFSATRSRNIVRPRQIAMALAKELTNNSLPEIGRAFGGKDHTTVLYAVRKIEELKNSNSKLEEDYYNLLRSLTA